MGISVSVPHSEPRVCPSASPRTIVSPSASGAFAGSPELNERLWFAIRVSSRSELRSSSELSRRGLEIYLPLCHLKRQWCDRIKSVEQALFPGYVFGRLRLEDRLRVLQTPGVKQIVGIGKTPAPISDGEIESLKLLVSSNRPLVPWPYLHEGQRVRIDHGPLAGVEGFVVRAEGGSARIVVSVNLLQRSVAAEIDRESIGLVLA